MMQDLLKDQLSCVSGFKRHEYKYLLSPDIVENVHKFIRRYLEVDEYADIDNGNMYTVRSIYFDSIDFKCYYEKIGGFPNREKFRIRTYNHKGMNGPIYL